MFEEFQSSTRTNALRFLLRSGQSSAANLATSSGISVQAMRRHLRNLEHEGLVISNKISSGPGRPSKIWKLTASGINFFNSEISQEMFTIDLLSSFQDNISPDQFAYIFKKQALNKATYYNNKIGSGDLKSRLSKLVQLRNQEGYLAEIKPMEDRPLSWYVNAFHCSIRNIAEKFPIFCDQELELLRNIFPDCNVQRVQWRIESGSSCGFRITQK